MSNLNSDSSTNTGHPGYHENSFNVPLFFPIYFPYPTAGDPRIASIPNFTHHYQPENIDIGRDHEPPVNSKNIDFDIPLSDYSDHLKDVHYTNRGIEVRDRDNRPTVIIDAKREPNGGFSIRINKPFN